MGDRLSDSRHKDVLCGGSTKGKGRYGLIVVLFMFLMVSLTSCSGGGRNSNSSTSQLPTYTQKFLYVANHESSDVYAYAIADDGTLSPVGDPVMAGGFPESITADPLGRFVYVANWNDTINTYTIGANGALTELSSSTVTAGSTPESVTVDPSGRFVYVANRVSGDVYTYSIADNGALTPVGSPILLPSGELPPYPETIAADPLGRFVYVANWGAHTVSAFKIGVDGMLTEVPGSPIGTGFNPYSVTVDPSGSFVYAVNDGDGVVPGTVFAYSVGPDGLLTYIADSPAGILPRSVTVDPLGKFAYVANYGSNDVSAYSIGSSGALTLIGSYTAGTAPYSVAVDPSGSFVYMANYGDVNNPSPSTVSAYFIESNGSLAFIGSYTAGTGPVSLTTVGILQ